MSVTIRDIAEKAGVSPSTVSLVLNNKSGVGDETRALVFKIADEMEYKGGRRSNRKNDKTIRLLKIARHGHIVNRDHNVFISDYIDGIEQEARLHGYALEVQSYAGLDHNSLIRDLERSGVAGALVLATELHMEDIPPFQNLATPLAFIDATHPVAPFDYIDMDNEGAVFSIIKTLKEKGHREIGLIKSSIETRNFKAREDSFYTALRYYGLEIRDDWIFATDSTFEQSFLDMEKILSDDPVLPSVLFCVCDIIALGCMKALKNHGLSIPEDISLVGFDNLPSSELSDPPLCSVKVSKSRIGRRAFQLLLRRINDPGTLPYEKVLIGSELILRDSLGDIK
ncbi:MULTISPECIES: LacI family DNA-binding transcriptional regulator [unclassified Oceanispirochaeta]|uniref:LacI family DNA-binding transcriptional regulator n=1 Tax=unclassified Oceanispirochaeta TaxID=2635722 RepID=UPI000E09CBB7|nr:MULTISPECIES: LacI family DNA-binding transcriptional regulator [unclassified Oceanispirochaeta]MBF9014973.1 LacI family DNA-binding transcriptional regulator [Oceanispirochaeta sp. M2]NPD71346.1 LacI family transcriptional regulator [Oceanispirochaeta sp. M1]RDG33312.1 LacI family transcriptional regulator [Oceanispirochaeta sp. M1]